MELGEQISELERRDLLSSDRIKILNDRVNSLLLSEVESSQLPQAMSSNGSDNILIKISQTLDSLHTLVSDMSSKFNTGSIPAVSIPSSTIPVSVSKNVHVQTNQLQ